MLQTSFAALINQLFLCFTIYQKRDGYNSLMSETVETGVRYRHYLRKGVHVLLGLFALGLRFIEPPIQVWLLGASALIAWILRPHWKFVIQMARPVELRDGVMWGVRYYFGTLFIIALLFPRSPEILGAAWLVLALGDGLSATVGGPKSISVPWNRKKRLYGTLACFVGSVGGLLLALYWFGGFFTPIAMLQAAFIGLAAAFVESLDTPLDDNLLIGLLVSVLCWMAGFFTGVPIWG